MSLTPPLLSTQMHDIDYKIHGDDMQFVEVELDPQEAVVASDFNSTGFLEPRHAERVFIDEQLAAHGLQLPTAGIGCSMYWRPRRRYEANLLDHVLAPRDLEFTRAEALGMCAELACAPQDRAPADYHAVSDHCPVRVELRR